MMLTEKECKEALSEIEDSLCELEETKTGVVVNCLFDKNLETINQLIEEHFDNPPLEWEEIKVNDVIFDKELKETIKIKDKFIFDDIKNITFEIFGSNRTYAGTYEENRFYRKEVQE